MVHILWSLKMRNQLNCRVSKFVSIWSLAVITTGTSLATAFEPSSKCYAQSSIQARTWTACIIWCYLKVSKYVRNRISWGRKEILLDIVTEIPSLNFDYLTQPGFLLLLVQTLVPIELKNFRFKVFWTERCFCLQQHQIVKIISIWKKF